jgi:mono/diheme cytochrome c family protein
MTEVTVMSRRLSALVPLLLSLAAAGPAAAQDSLPPDHAARLVRGQELFVKQVRALLLDRCVKCHGGENTRGGLDLTTREGLLRGGQHGAVVALWDGKASKLVRLVSHTEEPHMPKQGDRLTAEQVTLLARWIDDGAAYDRPLVEKKDPGKKALVVTDDDRRFWSFRPLKRPAPPTPKDLAWCRTPIDRFVLARLEEKGLAANPPADRRTLIRRASFDLTGLPPTRAEIDDFLADRADDRTAYARLIDRLLTSPAHGERWARHWLDLARFAESHGYEHDYDRPTAYHYRDFVIKALNQDLPFNTFVKWQIAGDELAPDNPLALTATGFLGAGVHSTQITANQVEKERYDELDDMVRTVGTAMLGLTIGCARCHDHKYDPIPTRDYYRLLSTFTTTVRTEYDLDLDPAGYRDAKAKFDAEHAKIVEPLTRFEKEQLLARFEKWLADGRKGSPPPRWAVLDVVSHRSAGGATFKDLGDGSLLVGGTNPTHETLTITTSTTLKGITAVRLEALTHDSLVKRGPGRASNGNFALSDFRVTASPLNDPKKVVPLKLVNPRATFEQVGLPVKAAIDDDGTSAWAIDPQFGKDHAAAFDLETPVGFDGGTTLTFTLRFTNNTGHGIGRPRFSVSTQPNPPVTDGGQAPQAVLALLARLDAEPGLKLSDDERAVLVRWYRTLDPEWVRLNRAVEEHAKKAPQPPKVKALICSEGLPAIRLHTQGGDFLPETHFLKRGDPNQKDGVATQSFLQVLMRDADGEKRWLKTPPPGWRTSYRRTALADWITDVDHGGGHLLARVIVNRLWQHHFGRGLVSTPSDFGAQGEKPSHPELLDWLACELIDSGWSLKHMHKLMMTSAVYVQGTRFDKARSAVDSENRLLWRRAPQRLEAEVIRDAILAVSGTLDTRPFGPGTLDPNHKRRSIYFTIKRSQLVPMMTLFDGPDALQGVEQRVTTTTAPQSLMMMNNALVRTAAKAMAERVKPGSAESVEHAVKRGFVLALGRPPSADELKSAAEFIAEQAAAYQKEKKDNAAALALTDFCQALLGLNEFIYVD